jgi:hypothetical protein
MKGDSMMRKLSVPLVCIAVLISTFLIPAVYATPPTPVSGGWTYTPVKTWTKTADGNTFYSGTEESIWTGDFTGTSTDSFEIIIHHADFVTCQGQITFTGKVNDVSSTMVILFVGKKSLDTGLWSGKWVILGGTLGLAKLHGEGTWEGLWYPALSGLSYEGKIQ